MTNELHWFKSSYSSVPNQDCVETAFLADGGVKVRDSKRPAAAHLDCPGPAWTAFTEAVKGSGIAPCGR